MAKTDLELQQATSILFNVPRGSEKGSFSLPSTAIRLDGDNLNLDDTASVSSKSSFPVLPSENGKDEIYIPSMPEKLCTGKHF